MAEQAAGLTLSTKECIIVPCTSRPTMHLISVVKDWLACHISSWAAFQVAAKAEFLGVFMGP
eukprot:5123773-Karenia_brevis.AAC.1